MHRLTGYIEKDPGTELYVAVVPGIPGAHTPAETLDELYKNLKEVVELCLEGMDMLMTTTSI
jgi:predicted RNase H-like HicB family nuclease